MPCKVYIKLTFTYFTTMSDLAKLDIVLIVGPDISGERLPDHWSSGLLGHL